MGFFIFMAYTIEEQLEELQKVVETHEETLAILVNSLMDEEGLSTEAREAIQEAYDLIYGKPKNKKS